MLCGQKRPHFAIVRLTLSRDDNSLNGACAKAGDTGVFPKYWCADVTNILFYSRELDSNIQLLVLK